MLYLLLVACSTTPSQPTPEKPASEAVSPQLGGTVDANTAITVDQLIASADSYTGKEVTVKGTIREVCQKKGCWHTLASSNPDQNLMVKDKEYQIFLPKDSAGKTAVIRGNFSVEVIPLEEARHYAQDAGKDPATITEAPKSFLMDAAGVSIL